jgi:hypothetical protein
MVDCAFFGTCQGIQLNLSHPAIIHVAFSTTKGLSSGNYRAGICFSRKGKGFKRLKLQNEWHHGIHLNIAIAMKLMQRFGPDFLPSKYGYTQQVLCTEYGIVPSNCVHLALGGSDWNEFSRDGVCNRIGLKKAIQLHYKQHSVFHAV